MEPSEEGPTRKVRLHKSKPTSAPDMPKADQRMLHASMDRAIAELIPGLADLSLSGSHLLPPSALEAASGVRESKMTREQAHRAELLELHNIFDMSVPNAVTDAPPPPGWQPKVRPTPRRIILSPYQYEMINYQRMHLRKNIWYYRDRMNVPRGPCPLHVLKDAWVQGVVDENTMMWGQGLYDWLPAKNIKLLLPMIRTPEGAHKQRPLMAMAWGMGRHVPWALLHAWGVCVPCACMHVLCCHLGF